MAGVSASTDANMITVLTIDGAGIRAIIPSVILSFLEFQIQGKIDVSKDAMVSEICIGNTATPTFLPPHYFETQDSQGCLRTFNLVDGAVGANNPALLAMSQVTREMSKESPEFFPVKPSNYGKFLVISLGTGTMKKDKIYSANKAAKWGILGWLRRGGNSPILDTFTQASAQMVDFHMPVVLQSLGSKHNYLRIQEDELTGNAASLDVSTKKSMENLEWIGKLLLQKPLEHGETVEEALISYAKILSQERRSRQQKLKSK